MKAVVFHKHGGSEVLSFEGVPDPVCGEGDVLVDVKACSLNHLDLWVRGGLPGIRIPLPHILGSDVAGVVAARGKTVRGFKVGDQVLVSPGMGCGRCRHCKSDRDSLCDSYQILGLQIPGGYAEKVAVRAERVIKISERLSFEEWAAIPLVFLTAWHMLHTLGRIQAGDRVLVHAAGSGIGSAAIQIAKLAGAVVMTTVGSDQKIGKAKKLGADYVINYREADFSREVIRLTGNEGASLIFEHIGPETWNKNLACLAKGGRMVTCGATSGPKVEMDLRFTFTRHHTIMGSYMGSRKDLAEVLHRVEEGELKPVVDKVFPLEKAREAHDVLESRAHFGKLILTP